MSTLTCCALYVCAYILLVSAVALYQDPSSSEWAFIARRLHQINSNQLASGQENLKRNRLDKVSVARLISH